MNTGKVCYEIIKSILKNTTIHANAVSHCNRCGCKIDSSEKVTVLNHAPDANCVLCSHPIANHFD